MGADRGHRRHESRKYGGACACCSACFAGLGLGSMLLHALACHPYCRCQCHRSSMFLRSCGFPAEGRKAVVSVKHQFDDVLIVFNGRGRRGRVEGRRKRRSEVEAEFIIIPESHDESIPGGPSSNALTSAAFQSTGHASTWHIHSSSHRTSSFQVLTASPHDPEITLYTAAGRLAA